MVTTNRQLTVLDQIAAGIAGFVICLLAMLVAWSISNQISDPEPAPMSNDDIIQATRQCERMGLETRFTHTFAGRATGYSCGSDQGR